MSVTLIRCAAAGSGTDIASGPATSGATSNWAFKLSGTGVVAAYQSFTTVPASATKVATSNAAASEVEIDTGYQVYISATQQADTYEGKVTYTVACPRCFRLKTHRKFDK